MDAYLHGFFDSIHHVVEHVCTLLAQLNGRVAPDDATVVHTIMGDLEGLRIHAQGMQMEGGQYLEDTKRVQQENEQLREELTRNQQEKQQLREQLARKTAELALPKNLDVAAEIEFNELLILAVKSFIETAKARAESLRGKNYGADQPPFASPRGEETAAAGSAAAQDEPGAKSDQDEGLQQENTMLRAQLDQTTAELAKANEALDLRTIAAKIAFQETLIDLATGVLNERQRKLEELYLAAGGRAAAERARDPKRARP